MVPTNNKFQIVNYDRNYLVAKIKYLVQGKIRFYAMFVEIIGTILDSYQKKKFTNSDGTVYWLLNKHDLQMHLFELERDVIVAGGNFAYTYELSSFHDTPFSKQSFNDDVSNMVYRRTEALKDRAVKYMRLIDFWRKLDVDSDLHLKTLGYVFSTGLVSEFENEMEDFWLEWGKKSKFPLLRGKDGKEFVIPSMEEYSKKVPACVVPKGLNKNKVQQLDSLFAHMCFVIDQENIITESHFSRVGTSEFGVCKSVMNERSTMILYPRPNQNLRVYDNLRTSHEKKDVGKEPTGITANTMEKNVPTKQAKQNQQTKHMTENNQLQGKADQTVAPTNTSSKPAEKIDKTGIGEKNVLKEQDVEKSSPSMEAPLAIKINNVAENVQEMRDSSIGKRGKVDKEKIVTDQLRNEVDRTVAPMKTSGEPSKKVDKKEIVEKNVLKEQNVDKSSPSMKAPASMKIDNVAEAVQKMNDSSIGKPGKVNMEKRGSEKVAVEKVGEAVTLLSTGQKSDSKSAKKKTDEWTIVGKKKTAWNLTTTEHRIKAGLMQNTEHFSTKKTNENEERRQEIENKSKKEKTDEKTNVGKEKPARNLTPTEHCVAAEEGKPRDPMQDTEHISTKKTNENEGGRHKIENASKEEKSTPKKRESSDVQPVIAAVKEKLSNSQKKKMKKEQKRLLEEKERQKDMEDYRLMEEAVRTDELEAEEAMKELYAEKMKLYQQKKGSFDFGDSRLTASNFARFRAEVVYEQVGLMRSYRKEKVSTGTKEDIKSISSEIDKLSAILDKYSGLMETNLQWNDQIVSNILMLKSNFRDDNFSRLESYCLFTILA